MKKLFISILSLTMALSAHAQHLWQITEPKNYSPIVEGQLNVGGTSPDGGSISVNNLYISNNGRPFIPVMGEFHFSRYPNSQWKEQLLKMKAGGINVVSTYVFWNMHEPEEGHFRWTGDYNLRRFVQLCAEEGLGVIVRIGPFCHGEVRNGGLPDWLYTKPVDVRSNDSLYLHYADVLYGEIAKQLCGLYYKDGGPIVGVQIENEHQHAGASWALAYQGHSEYTSATYDESFTHFQILPDERKITTARFGDEHMMTLMSIARKHGIDAPVFTATGWGNAAVLGHDGLPMMAAYTYAPWMDMSKGSPYCLFTDLRKHPDYSPVRFNPQEYPCLYAEMGGGMMIGYGFRGLIDPQGIATTLLRTLGSGCNGPGYYMYQGGVTPRMNDVDYYNDGNGSMPHISYDYQAPLGENGLERPTYRRLRIYHNFINDFGSLLAPMQVVLPENASKLKPLNRDDLRYCARMKDGSGFLFLINYQDHDSLRHDMNGLQMMLNLKSEKLRIPQRGSFSLPKDENLIIPFNMLLGGATLKYAIAQPLMKINDRGVDHYFFFVPDGTKPEYCFDVSTVKGKNVYHPEPGLRSTYTVKSKNGSKILITTLTEQQALDAVKVDDKLLITKATVLPEKGGVKLLSFNNPRFSYIVYPSKRGMTEQIKTVQEVKPEYKVKKYSDKLFTLHFPDTSKQMQVNEYFMRVDYTSDVIMSFLDNHLVADDICHGLPWTVALNRYKQSMGSQDMTIRLRPNKAGQCNVRSITILPEYITQIDK